MPKMFLKQPFSLLLRELTSNFYESRFPFLFNVYFGTALFPAKSYFCFVGVNVISPVVLFMNSPTPRTSCHLAEEPDQFKSLQIRTP